MAPGTTQVFLADVDQWLLKSPTQDTIPLLCTLFSQTCCSLTTSHTPTSTQIGITKEGEQFRLFTEHYECSDVSMPMAMALVILRMSDTDVSLMDKFVENRIKFDKMKIDKKCALMINAKSFPKTPNLGHGLDRSIYGEYSVGTIWKVLRVAEARGVLLE